MTWKIGNPDVIEALVEIDRARGEDFEPGIERMRQVWLAVRDEEPEQHFLVALAKAALRA